MKRKTSHTKRTSVVLSMIFLMIATVSCDTSIDSKMVVVNFKNALNSHSIDSLMGYYADEIVFSVPDLGMHLSGKEALRGVAAYDSVLHTSVQIEDLRAQKDTVFCSIRETNDWMDAAGISIAYYPTVFFIVDQSKGKILLIEADMADSSAANFKEVLGSFIPWVQREHGEEFAAMAPGGKFEFNGPNGETMVRLLKEWRSRPEDGR